VTYFKDEFGYIHQVIWHTEELCFGIKETAENWILTIPENRIFIKVIGNIHENRELAKY